MRVLISQMLEDCKLSARHCYGRTDQRQQMSHRDWHEMFPNPLYILPLTHRGLKQPERVELTRQSWLLSYTGDWLHYSLHDWLKPLRTFPLILLQWLVLHFTGDLDELPASSISELTGHSHNLTESWALYLTFIWRWWMLVTTERGAAYVER